MGKAANYIKNMFNFKKPATLIIAVLIILVSALGIVIGFDKIKTTVDGTDMNIAEEWPIQQGTEQSMQQRTEQSVKIENVIIDGDGKAELNEKVPEKVLDELILENADIAQLIYNANNNGTGDVAISFGNERIVLRTDISEAMLFGSREMPNAKFKLHKIKGDTTDGINYIGVTEHYPTMMRLECNVRIFKIADNHLIDFWSSDVINLKLLNVNRQEIEIGSSLNPEPIILRLTEQEGQMVADKLASLQESNVKMDESFWNGIQENILRDITGCNWLDMDSDGDDEMIISLYCRTVGAITPVHLREKAIMIFEVADSIELRKVIFERDNKEEALKPYFIGEV